jgi:hypothetical protein
MVDFLKDDDLGPITITGMISGIFSFLLSLILLVYYLVKGSLIKETSYKCGYCKNKFSTGLIVHEVSDEEMLDEIRKH